MSRCRRSCLRRRRERIRDRGRGSDAPASHTRFVRWHGRVLGICLVIFAFELGLFLLVFPWLPNWDLNWIPLHSPFLLLFG